VEETLIDPATSRTIVVGIQKPDNQDYFERDLLELESLLKTLRLDIVGKIVQKRAKLSPSHLLGWGKVSELKNLVAETSADLVVVDHALSGPQVRNLERDIKSAVIDRSGVILDIFARHALSKQAKSQVQIAQLEYLLPRLTGAWTHFQRQTGGGVKSRGMGEKQIEIDRRRARQKISMLNKRLKQFHKENREQKKSRSNQLNVAIVGYTNTGKTSLMKGLTKTKVEGKDELFATLEARTRTMTPNTSPRILLSDTVGFIRNLPHSLVASFRSTLEEALEADLLIHVVDISHQDYKSQIETTEEVLADLGAQDIPMMYVFNKIDLLKEPFLGSILNRSYKNSFQISTHNKEDIQKLRLAIYNFFEKQFVKVKIKVSLRDSWIISYVYQNCLILSSDYSYDDYVYMEIRAPQTCCEKLKKFVELGEKVPDEN
jgi:GTPase